MAVADLKELDTMGEKGYFCEGPLGYIYTQQVAGSSPVYRVLKKNGEHYITQDINRERKQSSYKSHKLLGYSKNAPNAANNETLHLEQYVLVGLAGGPVRPSILRNSTRAGMIPTRNSARSGMIPTGLTQTRWKI